MKKSLFGILFAILFLASVSSQVSAHVVVKPNSVGVGTFQTFTIGVPVEKEMATTTLRLVIPDGLEYVTPNVKPGWNITITKSGEGESAKVTQIEWKGGSIPSGQRDEFIFSAKVPGKPADIAWKAYQTYKDGSVVSWDQDPKATSQGEHKSTPYSVTSIVDDLSTPAKTTPTVTYSTSPKVKAALGTSLALSVVAFIIAVQKKKEN